MTLSEESKLISGASLEVTGVGKVYQPTIGEILGDIEKYEASVSLILFNAKEYLEEQGYNAEGLTTFQFLLINDELRLKFIDALNYFLKSEIKLSRTKDSLITTNGVINNDNYVDLQQAIFKVACINNQTETAKPASKKAAEILEKINKAKKKIKKQVDKNLLLPNMVGAYAARTRIPFNYINEYTLYQFYDQFYRNCMFESYDTARHRWIIWGKDTFDTQTWYKKE